MCSMAFLHVRPLSDKDGGSKSTSSTGSQNETSALGTLTAAGNTTSSEVDAARKIVQDAIAKMRVLNKARFENPARNRGRYSQDAESRKRQAAESATEGFPVLVPTDEMSRAAALLAELEAEPVTLQKRATTWWMQGLKHLGSVPWGPDASYKTYRNVIDYGADPTGSKDSTAAIQKAIDDGKRCGANCNGSTVKNAIVYFPPGRYLVSKSISVLFGTQIIGDANDPPTIVASASYIGLGVLSTDVYVENGGVGPDGNALEWYINTARFYGQIRNIKIDITATDPTAYVAALHYQMAQATDISQVTIVMKPGTTHQGIYAENGSGGVMSDMTFIGGNFGIYGGAQQFSASRMTFNGCSTGVQLIWDWGWSWKSVSMNNVGTGFRLYNDGDASLPGSVSIIDSILTGISKAGIEMVMPSDSMDKGYTGLRLIMSNSTGRGTGYIILAPGYYHTYVIGSTYFKGVRTWSRRAQYYTREPSLLGPARSGLAVAPYLERARPQYQDRAPGDFVHLKDLGARGDGSTDDTAAIQAAFSRYGDGSKVIYVDAGSYIIKDTVLIPPGAKVVGETWSQLVATGAKFGDAMKPVPMLKVGSEGDVGSVELQDLILTSRGPTPGLVVMEWNIAADFPGSAGLWDVHVRLGGAVGTQLTPAECPPIRSGLNPASCQVASMMLHVTRRASGYFDNVWLWVGDHQIDDPKLDDPLNNMDQITVYCARGMLIESQKATWLYGTASEHSVMYQYNFEGAMNVFSTMLQTETPYYQPTPKPPAPFAATVGIASKSDPFYDCQGGPADGCDASYAVVMRRSQSIHISTAGTYSWFSTYTQDCISSQTCQKNLWLIGANNGDNVRIEQLITIGAKHMFATRDNGPIVLASDNFAVSKHPKWSHISLFQAPSFGHLEPERFAEKNDCRLSDNSYSTENVPVGTIASFSNDGSTLKNKEGEDVYNFVTIVNLTPHRLVKQGGPTPYQVEADFADVPPGRARQFRVTLEGTNKRFHVHIATHMDDKYERRVIFDLGEMGMGWRELGFPGNGLGVALVITGSEQYGYYNSLQLNGAGWQQRIKSVIQNRQLRHVVVPGSHDAGMNTISTSASGWTGGGVNFNTETQSLDLYNQLRVGARYFDMRIYSINGDGFWSAHINDDKEKSPVGATGASLDDLIAGVNRFTTDFPGEVIVWFIKGMRNLQIANYNFGWSADTQRRFLTKLEGINNRCPDLPLKDLATGGVWIDTITMGSYMTSNSGRGCVLLVLDAGAVGSGLEKKRPSSGIYSSENFRRDDTWPNKPTTEAIAAFQLSALQNKPRNGSDWTAADGTIKDDYFILQWHTTKFPTELSLARSIQGFANQETNPSLYHVGMSGITPQHFPTVIQVDALGLFHTSDLSEGGYNPMLQTLCIGLNLYMVSENCALSKKRNPLPSFGRSPRRGNGKRVFTGVIFANGTVLDQRPPDFCSMCTFNDTVAIDRPPKLTAEQVLPMLVLIIASILRTTLGIIMVDMININWTM
ncbi:pectate lyase superfamily protein-domain-containing protein [Microdochium trichocladiopsis]|uniref:Pectate lyase superfamily protein-domain-containing protein n=1 Tax=Microdochium trichocladiopsis TaxID=1682393 RepID=A0A9P8XV84_9PEZI|nr:pectate lyase superfamily protein-domain-containing protein [Microdochium trichocladiopsis]KAH7017946.1 pectate lyase superfamily protein-domain-containing protein [Microdochium trichocladiopsis]